MSVNEKEMKQKMRAGNFIENNGIVLRAINIGRTNFNKLRQLRAALEPDIGRSEFADCVNYLSEAGYISLRRCGSKAPANVADDDIDDIEAKVSANGIRLLAGKLADPCIRT